MEYLTVQEPRSLHFGAMDRSTPAFYSSLSRDDHYRHSRSFLGRSQSPAALESIDPALRTSKWQSPNGTSYAVNSASPAHSVRSMPPLQSSAPRSIASLLQTSQTDPVPQQKRLSGGSWASPPSKPPTIAATSPVKKSRPKDDRPTLPSFNALVADIERTPEPQTAPRSMASAADQQWKRQEPTSFPSLEPYQYHNGARGPSGYSQSLASSEPTSPNAYSPSASSLPPPIMSPRSRLRSPPLRGHIRRASDYRNRTLSHLSTPPHPHDRPAPSSYPTSHHRTNTFPSFPTVQPSTYKSEHYQQQPLPDYGTIPPPGTMLRHPTLAPAPPGHPLGHSRNDSVMNTTEEARYYPSTSTFHSNPAGPSRKRRGNLPKDATRVLRQWFDEHLDAPYPGEEVKNSLCLRTGLQMSQVNNWFINARRRLPRQDRARKDRESTEMSDGSPTRTMMKPMPQEYWA